MSGNKIFEIQSVSPNNNIPIDFSNMSKLPESHIWEDSSSNHPFNSSVSSVPLNFVLPVIDLNDSNAIPMMKKAFEEWGMFQLINHGISMELLEQMENQTRKLFALPIEQKLRALRPIDETNGYGIAKMSPLFKKLMWSEGFSIQGPLSDVASQLWPKECNTSATFYNVMNDYDEAMKKLSQKILSMMLTSLDLNEDDVKWYAPNTNTTCATERLLQINSYPVCPEPNQAMGLAPHTDTSLITVLYQSNTSGLQLYHDQLGWINVPPMDGALVVNVGDLLQILSNGVFKKALHRAMVNLSQHRISVAYFLSPPKDADISPPLKLVKDGDFPLYRSITWKEYLNVKTKHFYDALDYIRFNPPNAD